RGRPGRTAVPTLLLPSSYRCSAAPACRYAPARGAGRGLAKGGRTPSSGSLRSRSAFGDPFVGGVDPRDPSSRQSNAFGRQPLRDDQIGMTLAYQTMIGLADHAGGGVGHDAEDGVRILVEVVGRRDMQRPDAGVIRRIETEKPRHLSQIFVLGRANAAVSQRN